MDDSGISYGSEAEPEEKLNGEGYGKGYLPFKWKMNGKVISRDPYEWELSRIPVIVQAWEDLATLVSGPSKWWSQSGNIPVKELTSIILGNFSGLMSASDL